MKGKGKKRRGWSRRVPDPSLSSAVQRESGSRLLRRGVSDEAVCICSAGAAGSKESEVAEYKMPIADIEYVACGGRCNRKDFFCRVREIRSFIERERKKPLKLERAFAGSRDEGKQQETRVLEVKVAALEASVAGMVVPRLLSRRKGGDELECRDAHGRKIEACKVIFGVW